MNYHISKTEIIPCHLFLFNDIFCLSKRKKNRHYKILFIEHIVELLVSNISFQHEFGKFGTPEMCLNEIEV